MEISAVTLSLSSLILLVSTANFLHLKDWYDRPKPAISFIEDECVHACDKEPKHTDYRLKIENKGRSIFYNANVKVVKMSRNGVILKINPFHLNWANQNTDGSRDVSDTPEFVNLVYTLNSNGDYAFIRNKSMHDERGIANKIEPGEWIITLQLFGGNNVKFNKQVKVVFERGKKLKLSVI